MKPKLNIQQDLESVIGALEKGAAKFILMGALVSMGYSKQRAETIIRWAANALEKRAA